MNNTNSVAPETIKALQELALVLKAIFLRLKEEGYQMIDGVLIAPNT